MMGTDGRVWFITGASSGFGRALAFAALERGDRVASTARDVERLDPRLREGDRVLGLSLEVADPDACHQAVEATFSAFGRIDVLVNNAGHGMLGAVEELSSAEAQLVFDSNVFGLLNVTRAVLPSMRKARSGYIVNVGSVGGIVSRAGSGLYCASKFAVGAISEALREELEPLGIGVTVFEPGPFRTEFAGRSMHTAANVIDDYLPTAGAGRETLIKNHGKQIGSPEKAARLIIEAIDSPEPPLHLVVGAPAIGRAEKKIKDLQAEIDRWRDRSVATAFD